ncbi:MAG: hypothetical protein Q9167_000329 [Letrouitia subvulpina]
MSVTEDLIDFSIIESHKENIQSLPNGRSAKALACSFAPLSINSKSPGLNDTRNLNDAIRQEYELELNSAADSDDPLDIYNRYVKWTLNTYPSAQATPESQLRPLLERATKAFQSAQHYKNDPRYLKLWLSYIRFFSDAPRETFAYLARHNIGEGLALFYEEFAAWLEGVGRWTQADEVYKLGIEREARPTERLARKFGEFHQRFERRVQSGDEPSSPALPTIRPALAAKVDPFALSTPRPTDPQAPISVAIGSVSTSRSGRPKIAIFNDADATPAEMKATFGGRSNGWDNIGSITDRKKENSVEARPWVGETLKAGRKPNGSPKMMIFKDESNVIVPRPQQVERSNLMDQQEVRNPKTGKTERVYVNLEAVYPNPNDATEEMSFEELRAKARGWTDRRWATEKIQQSTCEVKQLKNTSSLVENEESVISNQVQHGTPSQENTTGPTETISIDEPVHELKNRRNKRTKVLEVKGETQTIKTNLESPTGPKLKRKNSAEPTMTLHTKAATEDILDIFNQPLRNMGALSNTNDSAGESEYEDDDYTSAGESTGTGAISGTSEYGDDDVDVKTVAGQEESTCKSPSPWSDFTASKHVPPVREEDESDESQPQCADGIDVAAYEHENVAIPQTEELVDVTRPEEPTRPRFIPIPPEDYEVPTRPYRDSEQAAQNRLPFMTPIVEKTESSMGALTIRDDKDYFNSKTPSRQHGDGSAACTVPEELLLTPFWETDNRTQIDQQKVQSPTRSKAENFPPKTQRQERANGNRKLKGPIIRDTRCNPVDCSVRNAILENVEPELSLYPGYHDYRPQCCNKWPEIRRFVKALTKSSKGGSDKTTTSVMIPPTLRFQNEGSRTHIIKREIGKGAFAPVYLARSQDKDPNDDEEPILSKSLNASCPPGSSYSAIKCEDPPTPWEFYIMQTVHSRLGLHSRASSSILLPYELHLFADEGYLIEQYLDQGTLLDLVNIAKADSPSGVLEEPIAMFFTVELLRTVESLHAVGILHGDLKADNCLVRLPATSDSSWDSQYQRDGTGGWSAKGLSLIDFGRGIDMTHFAPNVQFVADWKTGKGDCAEMREMRPWTWQVDYWGLAGVIHSLLFGKYIEDVAVDAPPPPPSAGRGGLDADDGGGGETGLGLRTARERRWKLKEGFKRYWQTALWARLFELLLNPTAHLEGEEGGKLPIMNGLRARREAMEAWLEGEGSKRGLKAGLRRLEERIRERKK